MRHHSQRVPGKNYRNLAGSPLYRYIVDALLESKGVECVVIDTDSPVIMDDCRTTYGDSVTLLERPEHLRAPDIPMNDILLNAIGQLDDMHYLQTHSTNPLLKTSTIDAAIERYFSGIETGEFDSLFSVTRRQVRIWDSDNRPLNHDPDILKQTQDLEPFYEENSCLYLFSAEVIRAKKNRIGSMPLMFEVDALEAVDIDEERDFLLAEVLTERFRSTK